MKGLKKGQGETYAQRVQREREEWTVKVIAYTQQEILDAVCLTLNEEFGLGEERLKRFQVAFDKKYAEIRAVERDDSEDGEYSRFKVEQALQNACGKYYVPHNERYNFKIIKGGK